MRKRMFFAVVLSLCVADFTAFAATARGSNKNTSASVATQSNNNVARSATRGTVTRTKTATPQSNVAPTQQVSESNSSQSVVARAAKQKALNTGTKVSAATENTAIPQDCQDAFYGCMDSFCMLDNASGGRCQCSDRVVELDQVLDDILKLDEQTYIMATEGVERIQMGEAENQIMARAKAAADKVVSENKSEKNKKQSRTLDLSAWDNTVFNMDDDIFDSFDDSSDSISTFADKKGDSLYKASAKMCAAQVSDKCKSYNSMLQLVYAQKIKSDCMAYENSLKAQKSQSQQKLLTAQKALRDAALDEYQTQNKYKTVGECTIAFTECMKTTAECGSDYTGCVTLAAEENVKNDTSGSRAKQTVIKGAIKDADITLAASTMGQLLAKKTMCESVTKQCVNVNKNDAVWKSFLHNAAPALKSAELIAEQNLRLNCLPSVAECYKTACKAQFGDNNETYDMCLSNPLLYKSLCKVQLEPCLEATGGSYDDPTKSKLWNGLVALLNAMKVDTCTAEIKSCLMDNCDSDFSGCIGLTTESIVSLCPYQKLTACMTADSNGFLDSTDEDSIKDYVAQIAQGLSIQVDNALATACQNAVNEAMINICGDTDSCESAQFDLSSLAHMIRPQICTGSGNNRVCGSNASDFEDLSGAYVMLVNKPGISFITYNRNGGFSVGGTLSSEFSQDTTNQVVDILKGTLNRIMSSIESDPKVQYCKTGRSIQGFSGFGGIQNASSRRFSNLTDSVRSVVANYLLSLLYEKNLELEEIFNDSLDTLQQQIYESSTGSTTTVSSSSESLLTELQRDRQNRQLCECDKTEHYYKYLQTNSSCMSQSDKYRYVRVNSSGTDVVMSNSDYKGSTKIVTDIVGTYDAATNICTLEEIEYTCINHKGKEGKTSYRCLQYDDGEIKSTTPVNMN